MKVHVEFALLLIGFVAWEVAGQNIVMDLNQPSSSSSMNGISRSNQQQLEDDGAGDGEGGEEEGDVEQEEGFVDPMVRLQTVQSVDDFLALLQTESGEQMTPGHIFSEHESEDGKRVIYTGGRLARPDDCSPRNTTVRLQVNSTDSKEIFFPRCTMVERCGGCCPSPYLKCVSAYTERIGLMVVKARATRPGSAHLVYSGIAPVVVDRHITCVVRCSLTQEICGPNKLFMPNQCICKCRTYRRCTAPQVFDHDRCGCVCPGGPRDCCHSVPRCGRVFNPRTCQCQRYRGRENMSNRNFTATNGTGEDMMSNSLSGATSDPTASPSSIVYDYNIRPLHSDICANVNCPRSFSRVIVNGSCRCRPRGRFARPRARPRGRNGK